MPKNSFQIIIFADSYCNKSEIKPVLKRKAANFDFKKTAFSEKFFGIHSDGIFFGVLPSGNP
jgi:hypothetical protein